MAKKKQQQQQPASVGAIASKQRAGFQRLLYSPEAVPIRELIQRHEALEDEIKAGRTDLIMESDLLEGQWRRKFADLADKRNEPELADWLRNPKSASSLIQ